MGAVAGGKRAAPCHQELGRGEACAEFQTWRERLKHREKETLMGHKRWHG